MKIPKYLTWLCISSLHLLRLISNSRGSCFQGDLTMTSSVLVSFNESLLPPNHWIKCINSLLTTDSIVPSFLLENIRLVLSAKWWMIDLKNTHCRSLMYRKTVKT